jgi:hypothetical protein
MPNSLFGLLLFVVLLVPGFVHASLRRSMVPTRTRTSVFLETTQLVTVSLAVNALVWSVAALLRLHEWIAAHTPDVRLLLDDPRGYALADESHRLGYVVAWAMVLLAAACGLAVALARRVGPFTLIDRMFSPAIVPTPAWYVAFEERPPAGTAVVVGCQLNDGSYVQGRLDWYSTEAEETADRDLMLGRPLSVLNPAGEELAATMDRIVISARDLSRIDVWFVNEDVVAQAADTAT